MADFPKGVGHYNAAGSNTLVQVSTDPLAIYSISVSNTGGSVGYLQVWNAGTAALTAGTLMDFIVPVFSGTAGAGTPSYNASRDVFYPFGRQAKAGLSYMWAAGTTGTVAHGVNAIIDITFGRE